MSARATPPEPTDSDLRAMLGASYAAYETFLDRNNELRPEWKYYGAKLGWSLKLFHGKRNLCFIAPRAGHALFGFVLGARAVDLALASKLPESIKQEIVEARVYAEGRGIRIEVKSKRDLAAAQLLLDVKKSSLVRAR